MKLSYTAVNAQGQTSQNFIDASDSVAATQMLYEKGLFVSTIGPAEQSEKWQGSSWRPNTPGRRLKVLADFMRNLFVLLRSGVTLTQALSAMERQATDVQWREVIKSLRTRIEDGSSLADAMADQPQWFDPITRSLIEAGESSGNLDEMLDRIAKLKRGQLHTYRQIIGALSYPILVLIVSSSVIALLVSVVLPRFTELFTTLQVPLPPTTRLLIAGGAWFQNWWWVAIMVIVASTFGAWQYLRSEAGKRMVDTALVQLPGVSRVVRNFITARVVRLMGVLLGSHVGLLEALRLIRSAAGNVHYAELLERAEDAASRGNSLSQAFSGSPLINPTVYEAIHNGEQSGSLDTLLMTVADFMDEDNDVMLKTLLSIVSPAMLVLLGMFVGFVAVSLFMPLFDLTAASADGGLG